MFERFGTDFRVSPAGQSTGTPWPDPRLNVAGYTELLERFAGCTFEDGLYRLDDDATGPLNAAALAETFPEFATRACPFGSDWLGRRFAVDGARLEGGEPLVLIMEPGTGEALEVPWSFASFHEQLHDLREPALAAGFFSEWVRRHPADVPVKRHQCVGYRVPLLLGGKDTIDNLETIDMGVYWSLCGQLRRGTRQLPTGTSIRELGIRP